MPDTGVDPQVVGLLTCWTAVVCAGGVAAARAAEVVEAGGDGHVVRGLPAAGGPSSGVSLANALAQVVASRPHSLRAAFPVPGDPLGLGVADPLTQAALTARSAFLIEGPRLALGWVPHADLRGSSYRGVRWEVFELPRVVAPPLGGEPARILEQADRALRRATRAATARLEGVDLARWRPEGAVARDAAGNALRGRSLALPPSWPPAARALADRAAGLWRALEVAAADPGASSVSAAAAKDAALRELSRAVREAATVAYNVPSDALLGGGA